jgi:hypothetical protein
LTGEFKDAGAWNAPMKNDAFSASQTLQVPVELHPGFAAPVKAALEPVLV